MIDTLFSDGEVLGAIATALFFLIPILFVKLLDLYCGNESRSEEGE
jgi:hypothetical protein